MRVNSIHHLRRSHSPSESALNHFVGLLFPLKFANFCRPPCTRADLNYSGWTSIWNPALENLYCVCVGRRAPRAAAVHFQAQRITRAPRFSLSLAHQLAWATLILIVAAASTACSSELRSCSWMEIQSLRNNQWLKTTTNPTLKCSFVLFRPRFQ